MTIHDVHHGCVFAEFARAGTAIAAIGPARLHTRLTQRRSIVFSISGLSIAVEVMRHPLTEGTVARG